jgi:hypothetical protein
LGVASRLTAPQRSVHRKNSLTVREEVQSAELLLGLEKGALHFDREEALRLLSTRQLLLRQ